MIFQRWQVEHGLSIVAWLFFTYHERISVAQQVVCIIQGLYQVLLFVNLLPTL
jgi:hypothetical protein